MLYRDTVSVEPGSRLFFWLGLGLERHIYWCRSVSRVEKKHFAYTNDTFCVSMGLETVSESVSKDTLMCVEHNLADMYVTRYNLILQILILVDQLAKCIRHDAKFERNKRRQGVK